MNAAPSTAAPRVRRADCRPPAWLVDHVNLRFDLTDLHCVRVATRARYRRAGGTAGDAPLMLDGHGLALVRIALDDRELGAAEYSIGDRALVLHGLPAEFELAIENTFHAAGNTSLMGLCESRDGGVFTQCEPEAFRRLTYFQDRPDVLCTFTTTLVAVESHLPVLLSNGHRVHAGRLDGGLHYVTWHNPVPTPCYLFAICAGRLEAVRDRYRFASGRDVEIGLHATAENIANVAHSAQILKRAMAWDERIYGREYDLDVYNCGAFNGCTGGMENKGLNLFDIYWFATNPRIAFDPDYEYRMKTIAHEYFHNWSGDIVTVRNWFHVCLKEGLTRFREQRFLGDTTDHDSVRIRMVRHIRSNQWTEDASPLVHPVICDEYVDPRNTFTNTTYDKAQEIVYMLMTLLGEERFLAGVRHFFDRHAYSAVGVEEFLHALDESCGETVSDMLPWFYQAGTPAVTVRSRWNPADATFELEFTQRTAPTPGQPDKVPLRMPVAMALLDGRGREMPLRLEGESTSRGTSTVLDFRDASSTYRFVGVTERPVPSLFRHFSAPVPVHQDLTDAELAHLLVHDRDGVTRWDVSEAYASRVLHRMTAELRAGREPTIDAAFVAAYSRALEDNALGPRLLADLLTLPDEKILGQSYDEVPIDALHRARSELTRALARHNRDRLLERYARLDRDDPEDSSATAVGERRLKAVCLDLLVALGEPDLEALAVQQLQNSRNVSNQIHALMSLVRAGAARRDEALDLFRTRWREEQLVYDKWFLAQASAPLPETASRLARVVTSADFPLQMLSRVFSTCEAFFCLNRAGFNERSGSGYRLLSELIPRLDRHSPLVATYMLARSDAANWRRFDGDRQTQICSAVDSIASARNVSDGLVELARKILAP